MKHDTPHTSPELRRQAEERLKGQRTDDRGQSPELETTRLVHELQVHQIELEMQNEELRAAQVELDASRARYFDLYDLAPVGYLVVSETGLVQEANLTAATLLGVNRDALDRQPLTRFILKEDQDLYYLHRKQLFESGKPQTCELRLVKLDGTALWARLDATATEGPDRAPACRVVLSDITERKQAEESLRESTRENAFQAELLRKAPVIAAFHDSDQNIVWANKAYEEATGLSLQNIAGKKCYSVWNLSGACQGCPVLTAIATGTPCEAELTPQNQKQWPESQGYWLSKASPVRDQEGSIIGAIEIAIDITERKLAEARLSESEAKYRHLIENTHDIIYSLTPEGLFTYVSPAWTILVGRPVTDIEGHLITEVVHPDDQPACFAFLQKVLETGQRQEGVEYRVQHISGEWRWHTSSATPAKNTDGLVTGYEGIGRDITERKRAEARELLVKDVLTVLNRPNNIKSIIRDILLLIKQQTGIEAVGIRMKEGEDFPYTQTNGFPGHFVELENPLCARDAAGRILRNAQGLPVLECMCGNVILGRTNPTLPFFTAAGSFWTNSTTDLLASTTEAERQAHTRNRCHGEGYESVALIPLRAGDETIGLLQLNDHRRNQFTLEQITFLEGLGASIGIAITRTQTDEKLRESAQMIEGIINAMPMRVFWKDAQLAYLGCNASFARDAGFADPKDLVGKDDFQMGWSEQAELYRADDRAVIESGRAELLFEETQTTPTGETVTLLTSKLPLLDSQGKISGVLGTYMDITERKQAEVYRAMGADVLQILNEPGDLSDTIQRVIAMVKTRTGFDAVGLRLQDGEDFPYYAQDGFSTEFLLTENTLIERGKDGGVCRDKDGHVCLGCTCGLVISGKADPANPLFTRGGSFWTNDSFPLLDLPADQDPRRHPRNQCVHDGYASVALVPIRTKDRIVGLLQLNDRRKGRFTLETVELLEGIASHIGAALMRKQAEEEQIKLQSQLVQAQKMESVGRLAGGVAHDFNNMLAVILGYTEIAMDQVNTAQPLFAALREIRKAAERSADLTRQLLAFARKQTIAPRVLDLNETVDGMLKMLRRLIGEDIDLVWKPGRNLGPVKVDPSQIDQLLANLCVNARDAILGVGRVTIETDAAAFDEAYCADHAGFVPGEYVLLAVSDNGCGMDQETLGHLFEPFFTTKSVGKGTGLGLATVYGMVQQNNGFVNVYSEPGQGTTFRVYLPRHSAKTAPLSEKAPGRSAERGHETILLVEDEPAILKMATMMLDRLGYTVVGAKTPGEAVRLAEAHAGGIHLLVTDVVMPEMNGRDLAKHLLSLHPNLKCLFMSGYTADVIANQGVLAAGVQFIQKPFSLKDLAAKLRQVLGDDRGEEIGARSQVSSGNSTDQRV
jgi:PAS domain S-box-containing protein